jgi:DNA helicase-2/ATP-dependent DNA helicase PcrA
MKTIDHFMKAAGFNPNKSQSEVILHENDPLYLPAGPGSGKTRILLWSSFNLIVYREWTRPVSSSRPSRRRQRIS